MAGVKCGEKKSCGYFKRKKSADRKTFEDLEQTWNGKGKEERSTEKG